MKRLFALLIITSLALSATAWGGLVPGEGPAQTATSSSGGGGSSHKQIDLDKILKALEEGKKKKPDKFEQVKKLLYIEPFSTQEYDRNFSLGLSISGNDTISRKDQVKVTALVNNPNPIEIRRALFLYLDVLLPGKGEFEQVNSVPQIIQVNEYVTDDDGNNITARVFPELTSFSDLKEVGPVTMRLRASDGQYNWHSLNKTLNLTNSAPYLENVTLLAPDDARYNDVITYSADVQDLDQDMTNITLHILEDGGRETANVTQIVPSGNRVEFLANQYGLFSKEDAGRNFSYYYTFGDGIAAGNTSIMNGPSLRKAVAIWVDNPRVTAEEENQFWWQRYNFSLDMKNQNPGEANVQVTLFTDTPSHPWRAVASKEVVLTEDPQVVYFDVAPFDVQDANQSFRYRFDYSEYDQLQQASREASWPRPLAAKLVRYEMVTVPGFGNIVLILMLSLLAGIMIERRFYR